MRIGIQNQALASLAQRQPAQALKPEQTEDSDFGTKLMDVLKEVSSGQQQARDLQEDLMTGQPVEYHDLMIAMERASTAMSLTLEVRNKLLDAYQEISRMQV
jgi:flagellar hook-basal body complex protein FliE